MWQPRSSIERLLCVGVLIGLPLAAHANADTSAGRADSSRAVTVDPAGTMGDIGAHDLYLQVTVNGRDAGLAHFGVRSGELLATHATLNMLSIEPPAGLPDPVPLAELPGLQVNYDKAAQHLTLTAPLSLLNRPEQKLHAGGTQAPDASAAPGLLLNYHLHGAHDTRGGTSVSAFTELRAFNQRGVFSNTALTERSHRDGRDHTRSVRLDTHWTSRFPDRMLSLRVGDTTTDIAPWSRRVRIAGVQVGTDFSLQPYRVTTPLAEFTGKATLPSRVELYINGMKRYSKQVPAGHFKLDAVPGITGSGQARLQMRNAAGQITNVQFSLYGTQQLLQQGLSEWSLAGGVVRRNYALTSFDYGHRPVVSGTWRHGVNRYFTANVHGEAAEDLVNAGFGGNWLLGNAGGVLSASLAESNGNGRQGTQWRFAYQWSSRHFHFNVQGKHADRQYRDIATRDGLPPTQFTGSAQVGFNTSEAGNFSLGYADLRRYDEAANRYASASWSKTLAEGMSLHLNVNQNLDDDRDRSIFLGFSMALGHRVHVSTGLRHQPRGNAVTAAASQSVPTEGGIGWRVQTDQGGGRHSGRAELEYLGDKGRVQVGADKYADAGTAFANADGALVLMDHNLFAARSINDGFAVVSTGDVPDVPVALANNPVGRTDEHGKLLVTHINAYQRNKISIDPMDLPATYKIGATTRNATPTARAGTLVDFDVGRERAATIVLVDGDGKPLATGSRVARVDAAAEPAVVGYDGLAYLNDLADHNQLTVTTPDDGTCTVAFDYPDAPDRVPQIGPLTCQAEASP